MRILVTNDDGIDSFGLKLLAEIAKKYGEVIVVAPKTEQSAKSQALNIRQYLDYEKLDDYLPGVDAYTLDSTPADCVRFAKHFLHDEFDIVFSGINRGFNLGEDILYSGTVGAASEGVMSKAIGISFSTDYQSFDEAKKRLPEVIDYIFNNGLLELNDFYNVNIPLEAKTIKITRQGSTHFEENFHGDNKQMYQRGKANFYKDIKTKDSDTYAIYEKYISITPLTVDRTNIDVFNKLKIT